MRGVTRLIVVGAAVALAGQVGAAEPTVEPTAAVAVSPVEGTPAAETPVAGTPGAGTPTPGGEPTVVMDAARLKIVSQLEAFCTKWMGFLATRERDNRAAIKWETRADGVTGQYVGYSTDYKCHLKESNGRGDTPVATIVYREFLYQKDGPSAATAGETAPQVKEATEVTEIFRYTKGQWVY